jgi:hypothetical protein
MPPNLQTVSLKFARRRSAKVMGSLAERDEEPKEGESVAGVLVTHNFHSKIVKPEDLATYTPLRVGTINSKLHVPFGGSIDTLRLFLNEMFAGVSESEVKDGATMFGLHENKVTVTLGKSKSVAVVEWEASPAGDVIADAVIALLMHAQSSAASIRLTSKPCRHPRSTDDNDRRSSKKAKEEDLIGSRLKLIADTLRDQFEEVEAVYEGNTGSFEIKTDTPLEAEAADEDGIVTCTLKVVFHDPSGQSAEISVECPDSKLASNVQECIKNLAAAAAPVKI